MSTSVDIPNPEASGLQQHACPKCGARRIPDTPECPTCGVIYAKHRPAPTSPTSAPEAEPNRFAAPQASLVRDDGAGHWREGKYLVVSREVEMTDRCVRCGAPGTHRKTQSLRWHRSGWYLLILVNLFFYLLVSVLVSTRAKVDVSLCATHRERQKRNLWIGLGALATSILMIFFWAIPPLAALPESIGGFLLFSGLILFLVSFIVISSASQTVAAHRITPEHVWLRKCGAPFLETLPEVPSNL